jgi:heterodisulfide reductase subunit C
MEGPNKAPGPVPASRLDAGFREDVLRHEEARGLLACFSCGTCAAGCPIGEAFTEYSPRKLAKMVKLGMRRDVLESPYIWCCTTCLSCEQHCPQNVRLFGILNVLKNMASEAGYAPAPWVEQTRQVMRTGLAFPTDAALAKKRRTRRLPAIENRGGRAERLITSTGADRIQARDDE